MKFIDKTENKNTTRHKLKNSAGTLVISWRSVLLVEETVVAGENQRPVVND
jgi:glutamine phosphoribosylpyrophosphate amidotransferase